MRLLSLTLASILGSAAAMAAYNPYAITAQPKSASEGITAITINGKTLDVSATETYAFIDSELYAPVGGEITASVTASAGTPKLLVDWDQSGTFEASEEVSMPTAAVPADVKAAVYRGRAEADGSTVDFLLAIRASVAQVRLMPLNGLILTQTGAPVAETNALDTYIPLKVTAVLPGFTTDKIIVRHGQGLTGEQYIMGNRQWADTDVAIASNSQATVSGPLVNGDVTIYALFEQQADSEWEKIWGDEFNGDALDTKLRWSYQSRAKSTWNRFCAQSTAERNLVNVEADGYYNSYCLTPEGADGMVSGAIISKGRFYMTYGYVEARAKTNPFTGNFPAFWMMPQANAYGGWPQSGEIDIWEQINAQNRSHATIHSGWTRWQANCSVAPLQASPTSTGNIDVNESLWHTYALEWDPDYLKFYVDGKEYFTYPNKHYSETSADGGNDYYTEGICWPFQKAFYVILNQSVGDGSWAASPDTSHEYLTQFDYVRCYKKKGVGSYKATLKTNGDDPDFYIPGTPEPESSIHALEVDTNAPAEWYDLHGRRIAEPTTPGLYIHRRGSEASKILL